MALAVVSVLALSTTGCTAGFWDTLYGHDAVSATATTKAVPMSEGLAPAIGASASVFNPAVGAAVVGVLGILAMFRPKKKEPANG